MKNFKKLEPHLKLKLLNKLTNKKPFAKIYLNPEFSFGTFLFFSYKKKKYGF